MHFIWGRQTTGHEAFTTKHVTVVMINGPARKLVNQTINSQQSFYHVAAHLPLQRSGSHRNGLKLVQNLPKTAIVTVFQVFHHPAPADTGKMSSHLKRLPHPFKCALHVAYPEVLETERSISNRLSQCVSIRRKGMQVFGEKVSVTPPQGNSQLLHYVRLHRVPWKTRLLLVEAC